MSVDIAKTVLAKFLRGERSDVLSLTGPWGVGKTHVWNEILSAERRSLTRGKYTYVSLFGLRSLGELRTAIFLKSHAVPPDGEAERAWWSGLSRKSKTAAHEALPALSGLPWLKTLNAGVETLAIHLVNDLLVCLDDLERSSIPLQDVLGLVSELKEEKRCKVALIFNVDALKDTEDYRSYKEKVVDYEVLYAPTVDEALAVALPPELTARDQIAERARELGITNIRILRRIRDASMLVLNETVGLHDEVNRQAVASVVLFCWCAFGTSEARPDLGKIGKWNSELLMSRIATEEPLSEDSRRQAALLASYGFTHVSDFDLAISCVVERGYVEGSDLLERARALDDATRKQERATAFNDVWHRFHRTFADDMQSFVQDAHAATERNLEHLSPSNLNGVIEMLRRVGRADLADALLDRYVDTHKDNPETFNLEQHTFGGSLSDPGLRERFSRAYVALNSAPAVAAAFDELMTQGFTRTVNASLALASEEDYFQFFMRPYASERHSEAIKSLANSHNGDVRSRARSALRRVRDTNELNALRVEWRFGPEL